MCIRDSSMRYSKCCRTQPIADKKISKRKSQVKGLLSNQSMGMSEERGNFGRQCVRKRLCSLNSSGRVGGDLMKCRNERRTENYDCYNFTGLGNKKRVGTANRVHEKRNDTLELSVAMMKDLDIALDKVCADMVKNSMCNKHSAEELPNKRKRLVVLHKIGNLY
eukprot:TRINITY_DN7821_c0_g2_i1.p1 TRINITY_DN7821_c0_g2~~TRINITY_DN7821_c0_g2_i1.p1  ORF type:complete len:164 (+),score=21.69 TRINITY_DN7821_c0_g2_i1:73-564(+)